MNDLNSPEAASDLKQKLADSLAARQEERFERAHPFVTLFQSVDPKGSISVIFEQEYKELDEEDKVKFNKIELPDDGLEDFHYRGFADEVNRIIEGKEKDSYLWRGTTPGEAIQKRKETLENMALKIPQMREEFKNKEKQI